MTAQYQQSDAKIPLKTANSPHDLVQSNSNFRPSTHEATFNQTRVFIEEEAELFSNEQIVSRAEQTVLSTYAMIMELLDRTVRFLQAMEHQVGMGPHHKDLTSIYFKANDVLKELKFSGALNFKEAKSGQPRDYDYQELCRLFLEKFPGKYDFARKFAMR